MAQRNALAETLGPARSVVADVFLPNRTPKRPVVLGIILFHAVVAVIFWLHNPWKVIPTPIEIGKAFLDLWNQGLILYHFKRSLWTFFQGVVWSALISFGLGYLSTVPFFKPIGWVVSKFRFWGLVGLQFIFTVIFGAGMELKVAILTFGMSVFLAPSIIAIVSDIKRTQYDDAWTLSRKMNEWRVLWYVTVRGTLHLAIEALRQNAAIGWVMLIVVEAIVQSLGGAGALMIRNDKYQKLDYVYAIQIGILIVGILQDAGFSGLRNILCPHYVLAIKKRGR